MKDILVLLILLNAHTIKVWSMPYEADSEGKCRSEEDYSPLGSTRCCKKCAPGLRVKNECNESTDTECEPCPTGQYIENWNYSPKCFRCTQCKSGKGVQYASNCSLTGDAKCICKNGSFCVLGYKNGLCSDCRKYTICKAGYGISVAGTPTSNVVCKACVDGTFSDTSSYKDSCRPHTKCSGVAVVQKGDALSDTVCESVNTTASTAMNTVSTTSNTTPSHGWRTSTFVTSSVTEETPTYLTTSSPPSTVTDKKLVTVLASVSAIFLVLICIIILVVCWKPAWKKDTAGFHPKVDANGNCESGDEMNQPYVGKMQLTSFTIASPEQQCLLEKGESSNDHSQCSSNTETRTDGCSSHESISPLQSTLALPNPNSVLSEPMTLLSNTEPITPQPSISTQSSSQPTSPQIISPVTPNPQVSVNITFHIGNGTCGTPSAMPTDLIQTNSKHQFVEEQESFSIPQQEAGKQSLMSVQESTSYSM